MLSQKRVMDGAIPKGYLFQKTARALSIYFEVMSLEIRIFKSLRNLVCISVADLWSCMTKCKGIESPNIQFILPNFSIVRDWTFPGAESRTVFLKVKSIKLYGEYLPQKKYKRWHSTWKAPQSAVKQRPFISKMNYHKKSNISRTFVGHKIVDNSGVVGASPVGAAPTTSSFST